MILIDLLDAPETLEGQISRKLLQVRPGVYVGALSKRSIEIVWAAIEAATPRAAMLVYQAKTETGISIKTFGQHRYQVIDCDGLQLIAYQELKGRGGRKFQTM